MLSLSKHFAEDLRKKKMILKFITILQLIDFRWITNSVMHTCTTMPYLLIRHDATDCGAPLVIFPELLLCCNFRQVREPAIKSSQSDHLQGVKETGER